MSVAGLVGRDHELSMLGGALGRVVAGRGGAATAAVITLRRDQRNHAEVHLRAAGLADDLAVTVRVRGR